MLGLVTLAALTRFLPPAEFGQYALYYFLAHFLALLYTLGWVRGGLLWVFGSGGDEDDDEEEDDDDGAPGQASAEDKRRALGTALTFIGLIAVAGTAVAVAAAGALAELLTGNRDQAPVAITAAVAGAVVAVWMLVSSVPRRERRPRTYVLVTLMRPVLVLAVTVPLVAANPEVETAVLGLAIGSAAGGLMSLAAVRRSFSLSFRPVDARNIARIGVRYTPLVIALWAIASGGVFFLGQYATATDAGYFRLASGVAAVATLPISAFITAWGPLRREPIYGAVEAERGKLAANGVLATYFALVAIWILLGFAVGADLLVRIAPGAYSEAASLIPVIGLGVLLQGWFRVVRRTAKFPRRWLWFSALAVLAAVVFAGACIALIPPLGALGAALAIVAGFAVAAAGMSLRSQVGPNPIPLGYGRILLGFVFAGACYAVARFVGEAAGPAGPVIDVAALAAYPLLLVATGTVPRAHLKPLRRVARAAMPGASQPSNGGVELDGLNDAERALLELIVRHRRPVDDVAPLVGSSHEEIASSFVAALRQVGELGPPSEADGRIGAYLLSPAPVAARDQLWRQLFSEGTDALDVDALTLTLERLRRAPDSAWRSS